MDNRYEVIPAIHWRNARTGATASIYGAVPWTGETGSADWATEEHGFTVHDHKRGTVGIGRAPWPTRAAAEAWVRGEHERLAACAARLAGA